MTLDEGSILTSIGKLEAGEESLKEGITEIKRELSEMRREVRDDVSAIRNDLAGRGRIQWGLVFMVVTTAIASLTIVEKFMVAPTHARCEYLQAQITDSEKHIDVLEHDIADMKSELAALRERTRASASPQKVFGDVQ